MEPPPPQQQASHPTDISYEKRTFHFISALDDAVSSIGGKSVDEPPDEKHEFEAVDNDPSIALESADTEESSKVSASVNRQNTSSHHKDLANVNPTNDDTARIKNKPEEVTCRKSSICSAVSSLAETIDDCQDAVIQLQKKLADHQRILMELEQKKTDLEHRKERLEQEDGEEVESFLDEVETLEILGIVSSLGDDDDKTPKTDTTAHLTGPTRKTHDSKRHKKRPPVTIVTREKRRAAQHPSKKRPPVTVVTKDGRVPLPRWITLTALVSASIFVLCMAAILAANFWKSRLDNQDNNSSMVVTMDGHGNHDSQQKDLFALGRSGGGRNLFSSDAKHPGLRGWG